MDYHYVVSSEGNETSVWDDRCLTDTDIDTRTRTRTRRWTLDVTSITVSRCADTTSKERVRRRVDVPMLLLSALCTRTHTEKRSWCDHTCQSGIHKLAGLPRGLDCCTLRYPSSSVPSWLSRCAPPTPLTSPARLPSGALLFLSLNPD